MKKLFSVLLSLTILFGAFGLNVIAAETVDWGLTLMADEVTPTGMTLVMAQSGGNHTGSLTFGSDYRLERRTEDAWEPIPYIVDKVAWTAIAHSMPDNMMRRWDINWEHIYGVLPEGHYRVVKQFMDFHESGNYDECDFYAEFMITETHDCRSWDGDLLCDTCLALIPHECRNRDVDTQCDICGKVIDRFCVIGNADWMGSWDVDSELGIMTAYMPFGYKVVFSDVPVGAYELQVIKHGSFSRVWGDGNGNLCFNNTAEADVTVWFVVTDGVGVVSVEGEAVELLEEDVFRVSGSADWMGRWDAANDLGVMTYVGNGVYRKEFQNVPAGCYELKVTKNGKWDNAYGMDGRNYCFTVLETADITVDFALKGGIGSVDVYGYGYGWDEDEDQEGSADTEDLSVGLTAALLLICTASLALLLYRRNEILEIE